MKKFKLLLAAALILIFASEAYCQTFGIKAGLNLANMLAKDATGNFDTKTLTGFHLGATAEFPVSEQFSFETGLLLSTKGSKENYGDLNTDGKYTITYLDIPLTPKVTIKANGIKYYGLLGPYLGIGLGGQVYMAGAGTKIKWGSSVNSNGEYLKQLDYGLNIGAGVEVNAIQVGLTYGLGLANISGFADDTKIYNRVLSLSVGYRFGKE